MNLPHIYKGEVKCNNNIKYAHTNKEERSINPKNIIDNLFKKNHMYKQDVYIKTIDKEYNTKIIGRTTSHIITINNEVIKIEDITDIKVKNE